MDLEQPGEGLFYRWLSVKIPVRTNEIYVWCLWTFLEEQDCWTTAKNLLNFRVCLSHSTHFTGENVIGDAPKQAHLGWTEFKLWLLLTGQVCNRGNFWSRLSRFTVKHRNIDKSIWNRFEVHLSPLPVSGSSQNQNLQGHIQKLIGQCLFITWRIQIIVTK